MSPGRWVSCALVLLACSRAGEHDTDGGGLRPPTCTGAAEEGCACEQEGATVSCGSDLGMCVTGLRKCLGGQWRDCAGGVAPSDEVCDGLDNDCNGSADERCGCSDGATLPCGTDEGRCVAGTQTCVEGVWESCQGASGPVTEECNAEDDDCNGVVDEGCACIAGATLPCGTDVGACVAGTQTCDRGTWSLCNGGVTAVDERCNGLDDDCDGATDEGGNGCGGVCALDLGATCEGPDADDCSDDRKVCNGANATACSTGPDDRRVGVHRSSSGATGEHFYTTSASEAACCGFTVEAYDFYFLSVPGGAGLTPWYRCYLASGFHFYTTSSTCEGAPGSVMEFAMGQIGASPLAGTTALHRLVKGNDHFYTTSAAERDYAISVGYASEGVAGYVWTSRCP
jgi:hypothetical protein